MQRYSGAQYYEIKLAKVMKRLGVESYDYDWSRKECWVTFVYKGQEYRFSHSLDNAQANGVDITYGSDLFAQVVLSLEDIARMVERGIYDLSTWAAGMQCLPTPKDIPECFLILGFDDIPKTAEEVKANCRKLKKVFHPDNGGSEAEFVRLMNAEKKALEYLSSKEK